MQIEKSVDSAFRPELLATKWLPTEPPGLVNPQRDCQTIAMRLGDFEITEPLPQLKDPHVIAVLKPWIDVGNVGTLGLSRIERHLRAIELGRLARPGRFYDFTRYPPAHLPEQRGT